MALGTLLSLQLKNKVSTKWEKVLRIGGERLEKKWQPGSKKLGVNFFVGLSFYFDLFCFFNALVIIEQSQ